MDQNHSNCSTSPPCHRSLAWCALVLLAVSSGCAEPETTKREADEERTTTPKPTTKLPRGIAELLEQALAEESGTTHTAFFPPDSVSRAAADCGGEEWLKKARMRRRRVSDALKQLRGAGAELLDAELAGAARSYGVGEQVGGCTVKRPLELQAVDLLFVGEQPGGRYRETRQVTCIRFDGDQRWYLMKM